MKNTLKLTHISILLLILLFGGCQKCKKEVCPQATTAKFKVYQNMQYAGWDDKNPTANLNNSLYYQLEGDTLTMDGNPNTFEALETDPNATFEWQIGFDDRIKRDKKFSLTFSKRDLGALRELDIRLIVRKTPNLKCNDDGVDTLTKKVYFIDIENYPYFGKFYGSDDDAPNQPYEIEIFLGEQGPSFGFPLSMIKNFPRDCQPTLIGYPYNRPGYQEIFIPSPYGFVQNRIFAEGCFIENREFFGYLTPDRKTIKIEHWIATYTGSTTPSVPAYTFKKRIFTGKKL